MSLDENFVNALYDELFEENFNRYKEILNQPVDHGKDSFARARNALALLDETERSQVIDFLKVVMFDSASMILGTLDGVHFPDNLEGDFLLLCDGKEIQGSLADIFVGKAQDAGGCE